MFDAAVIGAGVMGCSTALHLARGGMRVALLDRGAICGEVSGLNAGALSLPMSRAALIPYALRGQAMWLRMPEWCEGGDVKALACPGLSLAFTEAEAAMLETRAKTCRAAGAPIELISAGRAMEIEPGLSDRVLLAGHSPMDGFASAHLTGRAFRGALLAAGVALFEKRAVWGLDREAGRFVLETESGPLQARRLILAGGVRLEEMAFWLGAKLPIKVLAGQLLVTERMRPVMRTVLGLASGLLSLQQYAKGTVLIGGGRDCIGDRARGGLAVRAGNFAGHLRLAAQAIPALREARILRAWLGLEAETADALPAIGPIPGAEGAWIIGGVPSGYAGGPYFGKLLAQAVLGEKPELPLFPVDRLLAMERP